MLGWCVVLIKVYFFLKKTIALLQLLHYCNSFLGGQLLHIAIYNRPLLLLPMPIPWHGVL